MRLKTKSSFSGIGFISLLQLLFICLKLIGVVNWDWFWVLSPFIFSVGFFVIMIVIVIITVLVKTTSKRIDDIRRNEDEGI